MSEDKPKADVVTPDPEAGLSERVKRVRRELLKAEAPLTYAAKEIARLRAKLARHKGEPEEPEDDRHLQAETSDLISEEAIEWHPTS